MPQSSPHCLHLTQDLAAGLVSQCSLHPPTSSEVLRRPDHEMPKLPVVRSRQSRVRGQPSQVAGALTPDNTQQPWRDE
ncbi:hypothetical protein MF6394_07720 [Pseudomonas sp. MF6394]|nr:hypothetical protein MF6394_07720 [Pseudomonas sp. MF6394]